MMSESAWLEKFVNFFLRAETIELFEEKINK